MLFSAFARFGFLRFTGKPPVSQTIYQSLRSALGGDENLGEETFSGPMAGKLYALAMALGTVQRTTDRVNRERIPHTSDEFLELHERDYRIVPAAGSTRDERRAALQVAEYLSQGCRPDVLQSALSDLLGSHLIAIRVAGATEFAVAPTGWDGASAPGTWKRADTVAKWFALTTAVWPGASTILATDIGIDSLPLVGGDVCVVDPGITGVQEAVTLTASGSTISATFVRPHTVGALITTEPWPTAQTTSRHVLVVTDSTVARSTPWRKKIATLLQKMLRSVDTWDVVEESAPGTLGPFTVGVGLIGITPIVSMTTLP